MERGRCEFWPLSRLTYKMYSVEACCRVKMPHVEFLFKQATNTTIDSAECSTAACTDGSGCGLWTTSDPLGEPLLKGAPLCQNYKLISQ